MGFFSGIFNFIRRNPLLCACLLLLTVAAPGVFGAFAIIFIVAVILIFISWGLLLWRIRGTQKEMEKQFREQGYEEYGQREQYGFNRKRREGEVTVIETEASRKKVSDDVGEYIDFKEVKTSESDRSTGPGK